MPCIRYGSLVSRAKILSLSLLSKKLADGSIALDGSSASVGLLRSILFSEDYSSYFNYFSSLADANPDRTIFSDITPSNSALSSDTLVYIKIFYGFFNI